MKKNEMPIVGYYGPCRIKDKKRGVEYDFLNDDIYQKIKNMGINLINMTPNDCSDEIEKQHVLDSLSYASKYDISMFVQDKRIAFDATDSEIKKYINDYRHYPAFAGMQVMDEPGNNAKWSEVFNQNGTRPVLADIASLATKLNTMENMVGFSNLLPFREFIGEEDYADYIEEYITTCHPRVLSFDYYLFDPGYGVSHPGYFINLSIMRAKSLEHGIPFWSFIQAGSWWCDGTADLEPTPNDKPTKGEFLWNVNTTLAYGAKGIEYFPLLQPYWYAWQVDNTYDYERNGLLGLNGEPTQWYAYAKEANKQIAAVGEILLQAESKEILAIGTVAQAETGRNMNSYGTLVSAQTKNPSYGAVIGCFDYQGKDAFYVVNYKHHTYGYGDAEEVTLNFAGNQKYRIISTQLSEGMPMSGEGDSCILNLAEGGAALVVIE